MLGSSGARSGYLRLGFATVEPAHDVGVNGPGGDLRRGGLLALAVGTLVGRADQAAFDEDVRAFLDCRGGVFGEPRTEDRDPMPLGLRRPLVFNILPRALRGDGKHGELRTVVPRLTLLRVGADKSDDGY